MSIRPKTVDSKAVLQTIVANLTSYTQRVSASSASHNPVRFVTFTTYYMIAPLGF